MAETNLSPGIGVTTLHTMYLNNLRRAKNLVDMCRQDQLLSAPILLVLERSLQYHEENDVSPLNR